MKIDEFVLEENFEWIRTRIRVSGSLISSRGNPPTLFRCSLFSVRYEQRNFGTTVSSEPSYKLLSHERPGDRWAYRGLSFLARRKKKWIVSEAEEPPRITTADP